MNLSLDPVRAETVAAAIAECLRQDFGARLFRPSCSDDLDILENYMTTAIEAYVYTEPELLAQFDELHTSNCGGGFQ